MQQSSCFKIVLIACNIAVVFKTVGLGCCNGFLDILLLAACMPAGEIWPYVDNAVSAVGRAKLEPKLRERRAAWMADISIEQCALLPPALCPTSSEV